MQPKVGDIVKATRKHLKALRDPQYAKFLPFADFLQNMEHTIIEICGISHNSILIAFEQGRDVGGSGKWRFDEGEFRLVSKVGPCTCNWLHCRRHIQLQEKADA
jgi:mRNA-degrading endonuclease RelE of RelBE toxin-antitoxin system